MSAHAFFVSTYLVLMLFLIAACIFATLFMSRRLAFHASSAQVDEEQQRIMDAMSEQRVMRIQNEALIEEIRERKKVEARLSHTAFHDALTGLPNRISLLDLLGKVLERKLGRDRFFAIALYIGIDHFKAVNDLMGRQMGDLFLIEMGQRLKRYARNGDILARMGGDEFALLLVNVQSMEQATRLAQRILSTIEDPIDFEGMRFPVTASIGLCEVTNSHGKAEDVIRDADTAMHYAKREGGARSILYSASMSDDVLATLQKKLQLKTAIERNEFVLHYQPIVNIRDGSVYGMEALIRWGHPIRGLVGPGEFIELAEETGYIVAIGAWVLRQACFDIRAIRQVFKDDLVVSVNVSSRQLNEAEFVEELATLIQEYGINPRFLQLEITESIFLKNPLRTGEIFKEIRGLGVKIACDDFGTGYSSLSYIERYPINILKIDQSFVLNMHTGLANAEIVRFIINLAHATGMSVSAEGVENAEQARALLAYGCEIAQGYLYGRPVCLKDMIATLESGINFQEDAQYQLNRNPVSSKSEAEQGLVRAADARDH